MKTPSGLQYSCCNEDVRSELAALSVTGRRVVSILAAGERAFGLLLGDPLEVIAIDRNPAQIHLGRLKAAAIAALPRAEYLGFIGIVAEADRLATYRRIREALPEEARGYWDARSAEIAEGIHAVGRTERSLARASRVLRGALGGSVERLRACPTLDDQAIAARAVLDRWPLRLALACLFNPLSGRLLLRDPVYYGEGRRVASSYLRERLLTTLSEHRVDDCFILSLFLDGHLRNSPSLPADLTEDGYPIVQQRIGRLRFEEACVSDYLSRQPPGSIDAFSLSDLAGYLTLDEFSLLLERVERAASDDATVCIREYISTPSRHVRWPSGLTRRPTLEARLDRADRSVGCTFVCAARAPAPAPLH